MTTLAGSTGQWKTKVSRQANILLFVAVFSGCTMERGNQETDPKSVWVDTIEFTKDEIEVTETPPPAIIPDVVENYLTGFDYPDSLLLDTSATYDSVSDFNNQRRMINAYLDKTPEADPTLQDRLSRVNNTFMMYMLFKSIRDKPRLELIDLSRLDLVMRTGANIHPVYLSEVLDRFPQSIKTSNADWIEKRRMLDRPPIVGTSVFDAPEALLFAKEITDTLSLQEIVRTLNGDALVLFTASWCSPCHWDYDRHRGDFRKLEDQGIRVISYSVDNNQSKWKQFIDNPGYLRECYLDVDGFDSAFVKQMGILSIPRYLTISKTGEITGLFSSAETRSMFGRFNIKR